ncbi:hypothetical protein [Mucilaginibacter paludis]|uniref:Helix-turn-helix domain-containing protein n=1 Tax=Mucilaginibacter paludis DSM 18603 TaxID=714943 RepID=H1YAG0_9SPHI|nr:hypothetical protein [Mucilaginibacter paludis]EHQ27003.1 hypothetical protein Mucpa_2894 [Mucilaginibacter paludis DSM 18603]
MEHFNYISSFFKAIASDPRISVTHIAIYASLLQYWDQEGYVNPLYVFSREIMDIARVSSRTTYRKAVQDLNDYGYLRYELSYKRTKGSRIVFLRLDV